MLVYPCTSTLRSASCWLSSWRVVHADLHDSHNFCICRQMCSAMQCWKAIAQQCKSSAMLQCKCKLSARKQTLCTDAFDFAVPEPRLSQSHSLSQMDQQHLQKQAAACQRLLAARRNHLASLNHQAAEACQRARQPGAWGQKHSPGVEMLPPGGHQSQAAQREQPAAAGGARHNYPCASQVRLEQQTCPPAEPG